MPTFNVNNRYQRLQKQWLLAAGTRQDKVINNNCIGASRDRYRSIERLPTTSKHIDSLQTYPIIQIWIKLVVSTTITQQ
jgi:hypothetical protein